MGKGPVPDEAGNGQEQASQDRADPRADGMCRKDEDERHNGAPGGKSSTERDARFQVYLCQECPENDPGDRPNQQLIQL
jgi:hypothetical protein